MVAYTIKSLYDLAQLYEDRATACANAANRAKTQRTKSELLTEARTWREAAKIARESKLDTQE